MNEKAHNQEFNALLDFLKRNRGFDFTGYKPASLMRRIQKRMQMVNCSSYAEYLDTLEVDPGEFTHLFNTILINVTGFFRDPPAWEFLRDQIIPTILEEKLPTEPIRIWSTGCASGEETYSLAMLFAEALGETSFRERVKIYATDVDEDALIKARIAVYNEREVADIPPDLLNKYFARNGAGYVFHKELRRNLIFGRNNLIQDAPISRIDLLVCRNTIMYFNAETQSRILARFHFALGDKGFLFLGKAEMLLTHANTYTPVDLKLRIFRKVPQVNMRDRLLIMAQTGSEEGMNHLFGLMRVRDTAFEANPVAQIVVDVKNALLLANEQARNLFKISLQDLGKPFQDLEVSYKPIELRSSIQRVYAERLPVLIPNVEWVTPGSDPHYYDVLIQPLKDNGNLLLGAMVAFSDVTRSVQLQRQLEHTHNELETAFEELQSTNEELETTNEELQSTIEELETTNEELQSTNEELETMNEELQSTNEELQTINDELRLRTGELNQANAFMESILTSVEAGVVVLDRELRVQVWNRRAEDLWGLRVEEVEGRNFLGLDIGLPVERLKKSLLSTLAGENHRHETTLPARNRRGREILCKVTNSPLHGKDKKIEGVIALMEEFEKDS
jgi:two-component system CheB/CheR fusion protein